MAIVRTSARRETAHVPRPCAQWNWREYYERRLEWRCGWVRSCCTLDIYLRFVHRTTISWQTSSLEGNLNLSGNAWPHDGHECPSYLRTLDIHVRDVHHTTFYWPTSSREGNLNLSGKACPHDGHECPSYLRTLDIHVRDVHHTTFYWQTSSREGNLNLSGNAWPYDGHECPSYLKSPDSRIKRWWQICYFCCCTRFTGGDRLLIRGKPGCVGRECGKSGESDCRYSVFRIRMRLADFGKGVRNQ